ncbi:dTDP-4-amino-4,6-dideoxyglucose formyltransferase [Salimicrobium album]|uniref:Formyl transferase n=1 Tax=Salimicrobium album TaxID=50717 RepID=A0A1H3EJU3_9BACI|nr:dTDP-4-amino-4,6-dideoxyglucose formyltransferase [Salimicrobium album]SDX79026.1 Formyl transferase [Salimicrobium album]
MNILVVTDNKVIFDEFKKMIYRKKTNHNFVFRFSVKNQTFKKEFSKNKEFKEIDIKKEAEWIVNNFDLVISLHSKQIFPEDIVNNVRCINVHPGFNPYNRGWYPQVFSIINDLPVGVTIHEMDSAVDHGPIILQEKVEIDQDETSLDVYEKIVGKEIELLALHFERIIENNYETYSPDSEGNVNWKKDFNKLCEIPLQEKATYEEVIKHLRALTHGNYKNAYFINNNGEKIYISVSLEKVVDRNE